jgi:GTPase Era involved in 16S rRNA processing
MKPTTIFLIGQISSGKSSLLNALSGKIVSNTSLQRETIRPERYLFSTDTDDIIITFTNELKNRHIENEKQRTNINDLNITVIKNRPRFLKTKYNLPNHNIVDFPGIGDIDDPNDIFFKSIEHNISQCDLIMYVTDANNAFINKNEAEYFNKLLELVENESNHGHYMDYMILVNKFDNVDDYDQNSIFNRISNKINIPQDKLFRCSSHKILIDCNIKDETNLLLPKFMSTETSKILKNSDIVVTRQIRKNIKNKGYINYQNIQYSDIDMSSDEDDYLSDNDIIIDKPIQPCDVRGDWDNFISGIKTFHNNMNGNKIAHSVKHLEILRVDIKDNYAKIKYYFEKFTIHIDGITQCDYQNDIIICIFESYITDFGLSRAELLLASIFFKYHDKLLGINIYELFMRNRNSLSNEFIALILYQYRRNDINNTLPYLIELLANDNIWTNFRYIYYKDDYTVFITKPTFITGNYKHKSWFINNLLNDSNTVIQNLIELSITPINELKLLDNDNILPYWLFDTIHQNMYIQIKYYIQMRDKNTTLESDMFKIDISCKEYINKYKKYKTFKKPNDFNVEINHTNTLKYKDNHTQFVIKDIISKNKTNGSTITRIFLTGNISAGKSSFLNALAGNLVSPTSKQQTNTGFQRYWFSVNGSDDNAEGMTNIESTDNNKNTEQTSLPTRYGLQDYVVYDFPGMNDNPTPILDDINNNIKNCNLLVYVIDYATLPNANVYDNFNKLHAMVRKQADSGKFVECVIVVNKWDDCREDENYMTTLCKNTSLPREKIFRCSSHKMLMNSLKLHGTNIKIPENMRDEWNYILRNTDVSDDVKKSLRTYALNGSDVAYAKYATDRDHVSRGDWNTFVEFVHKLQGSILTKRRRLLETTCNKVFENTNPVVSLFT